MKSIHLAAFGAVFALSCAATSAQAVDFSTLQLNGSATATASKLRLTPAVGGLAGSAFLKTAFDSTSTFTSSFTFTLTGTDFDPQADGITFMIQNNAAGTHALGGGGGGIGAEGLDRNVGVGFQSWDNDHATIFTDGDVFGGTAVLFPPDDGDPMTPDKTPNFFLGMHPLNVVDVNVSYDGTTLIYSAFNNSTGQAISDSLVFDLTTLGPQVYFGFTGGTGLSYSTQDITNWTLDGATPIMAGVPEPASWTLMIAGFGGMGAVLRRRRAALA